MPPSPPQRGGGGPSPKTSTLSVEEKKESNEMFEIDIPLAKHAQTSFDSEDNEQQNNLAKRGRIAQMGSLDSNLRSKDYGRNSNEDYSARGKEAIEEVYYNDGATDLFLALEDTDWRKALHILQETPIQAKIWVISTGTVETTLGWSLWRRLPLHEACRRQGPAWLISALLSVYPLAAEQTTQFGELPLHLAVECGAPPEVVNLLVVTYWHGIMATDQSGRTPLEILQDTEMLAMEDHQVVFESLTRSLETYQSILEEHQEEVKGIKAKHASGLVAIRQQHDEDLQQEQEQQEKLLAEVDRLRRFVDEAQKADKRNVETIQHLSQVATNQCGNLGVLKEQLAVAGANDEQKVKRIVQLEQEVEAKSQQIAALQAHVRELQSDLQGIAAWQQDPLSKQINITEESMQTMVEQFVGMVDLLSGQGQHMTTLLKQRNIPMPTTSLSAKSKQARQAKKQEEQKKFKEQASMEEDALMNIAAAASSALQY